MARPNQNWNPPRGPRHRHPRGRGQGPASSDPTPAPRTRRDQNEGQYASTQNPQRYSDPFHYDTQSMPYWDDASGAIHDIPSSPPRQPARSYAQDVIGEARSAQNQPQASHLQIPLQSAFNNPYLDIVGDGPYGRNQASYGTYGAPVAGSGPAVKEKKGNRRDFTPYLDAADARNGADLGSPRKESFRTALGTKDANLEVRRDATNAVKTATARRDKLNIEKSLPLVPGIEPRPPPKAFGGHEPPQTPTMFKSKFEFPTSPKIPKAGAVPSNKTINHQQANTLSPVVQAPSPLKVFSKKQPNPHPKLERTPTVDRILSLRAEGQAKALAQLEGGLQKGKRPSEDERHAPRALSRRISDSESQRLAKHTSREEKRQASEFIADLETPKPEQWTDICMMNDRVVPAEQDDASSSVSSSDDNAQEDEIARLSKAIADLRPFQDLPSPNQTGFQRKSAVPVSLDMSKIEAGKGESDDGTEAQKKEELSRYQALVKAQTELLEVLNATDTDTRKGGVGMQGS